MKQFAGGILIVNIAGWLYIVQAGLTLLSMAGLPLYMRGGQFGTLIVSVVLGAIGVGLLRRLSWARWIALGTSFIGWTFGALMLLALLGLIVVAMVGVNELSSAVAGGVGVMIALAVSFFLVALVFGIVLNFKLFMHLISDVGKEEFSAPDGSTALTVFASSAVWLCIVCLSVVPSSGGRLAGSLLAQALNSSSDNSGDRPARRAEAERALALRREEARLTAARELERRRADQEAAHLRAERNAAYDDERIRAAENAERERAISNANSESHSNPRSSDEEEKSTNKILKCQDPSGGVSYTQGYCPAGTKEVAAPKFE